METEPMTRDRVFQTRNAIVNNCKLVLFGMDKYLIQLANGQFDLISYFDKITGTLLLGQAHHLLFGGTGVGKTAMMTGLTLSIDAKYSRIQGTEEVSAADILGAHSLLQVLSGERRIVYIPGDITSNIVFVDESSRLRPKAINALLEGMEERSFTPINKNISFANDTKYMEALPLFPLSGDLKDLTGPRHFSVFLTQNPFEEEQGVYPTPQALWDRVTTCMELERPSLEDEMKISSKALVGTKIRPVTNLYEIGAEAMFIYNTVSFKENSPAWMYKNMVIRNTDPNPKVEKSSARLAKYIEERIQRTKGASPRVQFHLEAAARVEAFFAGDDIVKPEHVKAVAPMVIPHRLKTKRHKDDARKIFAEVLEQTPIKW